MKIQILICLVLAVTSSWCSQMPILVSGNQTIQSHFDTQEEAIKQISESVKQQNQKNVVIYKVETPYNLPQTLKEMRKYLSTMPTFQKIFGSENSFQSTFVDYDAQSLVEELSRSIDSQVATYDVNSNFIKQHLSNLKQEVSSLEVIKAPITSLKKLEQIIKSELAAVQPLVVVLFEKQQGKTLRLLEEDNEAGPTEHNEEQHTVAAADDNAKSGDHYLSDIKPSTVWALIVVLLVIFTLYCGIGQLASIQSPESFVAYPFHVGKES